MECEQPQMDLGFLAGLVGRIEEATLRLMEEAQGIQAVERNCRRILASARMLRLNLRDPLESGEQGP